MQCILCKHNPNKRCLGNFAHKYWVGDRLLGKCDGDIQVELIDEHQQRFTGDLANIRLEVGCPHLVHCSVLLGRSHEDRLNFMQACSLCYLAVAHAGQYTVQSSWPKQVRGILFYKPSHHIQAWLCPVWKAAVLEG